MKPNRTDTPWIAAGAVVLFLIPLALVAGPPLLCYPFDIGGAKSLPWGGGRGGWQDPRADYDLNQLVPDTLALLGDSAPVIVRMETLRRATVYAMKDDRVAAELLERLLERTRAAGKGKGAALALFDAGYLIEVYGQARHTHFSRPNPAAQLDGYEMVAKAIAISGGDATMEFAAALIAADGGGRQRAALTAHLGKALDAAVNDPLLARNIDISHLRQFGRTNAELRAWAARRR